MMATPVSREFEVGHAKVDFLSLELTKKCPLNCIHCYSDSSPTLPLNEGMSFEAWADALTQAYDCGCREAQYIGGEPALYPHLLKLVEKANALGYQFIEVYTSGTTLTEPMILAFRDHHVALAFSLYSHRAYVHDSITQREGSHAKTLSSIKLALRYEMPVRVAVVEMAQNKDDVDETKKYLRDIGVQNVRFDRKRGIGRGADSLVPLNPMSELCGRCWRGRLMVDSRGDAYPCVFARFRKLGNVAQGLRSILESSQLKDFCVELKSLHRGYGAGCPPWEDCTPTCIPPNKGYDAGCTPWEDCTPSCIPPNRNY